MPLFNLLFEDPGPLIILLIAAAVVLRIVAHRQSDRRLSRISLSALVAAVAVSIAAWVVTTDREAIIDHTQRLVDAAGPIDADALQKLIINTPTMLDDQGKFITTADVDTIVRNLENRNVATHSLRSLDAVDEGRGSGTSYLLVQTKINHEIFNYPQNTRWAIEWRKEDDGTWKAVTFQWLEWNGQPPNAGFIQ